MSRCGLHARSFDLDKASDFVDLSLQNGELNAELTSACNFPTYEETNKGSKDLWIREKEEIVYKKAMQMFCDMKSQKAFRDDYNWPELPETL